MESRVQAVLEAFAPAKPRPALETMEHLALLKRWYYRGHRIGEIFLADQKSVFPIRRIVRGIGRVLRGERPEVDPSAQNQKSNDSYASSDSHPGVPPGIP
jgi:hypothetical protein